jgi:hypothetical protein
MSRQVHLDEVAGGRVGRPEPERTVHMGPAAADDDLAAGPQVVAGPRVDVARLQADDGRSARALSQHAAQVRHVHRAVRISPDRLNGVDAQAQQSQRPVDRGVPLLAGDHPYPGRADESQPLHVPPGPGEYVMARRRDPGGVRRLSAGDEPDRGGGWQAE